mmetsp:Transcript_11751/g.20911  ORF Transcript_11751/g.20911 Transcript_11751/m.20911 type:complete len:150 (-) Transcript_11751:407-856(-)
MSLHQHDRRLVLYPAYLDAGSTVAQGRVLAKAEACPHPDVMEMYEACRYLGLQTQVEDKHYPRAWWTRGRLRVKLCDTAGDPVIASIPNKRTLLQKVSAHIKAMPVRKKPPQYIPPPPGAEPGPAVSTATKPTVPSSGGNKKKNRGGKK